MDEIGKYVKNLGLHNHTSSKQYNMQKMDEVGKQCLVNFNARNSRLNSRVITPIPSNSFYKTPILSLFPFFFLSDLSLFLTPKHPSHKPTSKGSKTSSFGTIEKSFAPT